MIGLRSSFTEKEREARFGILGRLGNRGNSSTASQFPNPDEKTAPVWKVAVNGLFLSSGLYCVSSIHSKIIYIHPKLFNFLQNHQKFFVIFLFISVTSIG